MGNIHTDLHELTAYRWFRAIKTNDLTWLLYDRTKKAKKKDLEQAFTNLNSQLIDELGISDDYRNYLLKLRAYNIAKAQWLISNNNFDLTMMEVAKKEFEKLAEQSSDKKGNNSDRINAERILGFRIDLKEVTVIEYYEYLQEADKIARSMSAKK